MSDPLFLSAGCVNSSAAAFWESQSFLAFRVPDLESLRCGNFGGEEDVAPRSVSTDSIPQLRIYFWVPASLPNSTNWCQVFVWALVASEAASKVDWSKNEIRLRSGKRGRRPRFWLVSSIRVVRQMSRWAFVRRPAPPRRWL